MSDPIKLEILDEIVFIEVGRLRSDGDYGNWKLSIRVPCRIQDIEATIDNTRAYIIDKMKGW